jgi:hypothetical protein
MLSFDKSECASVFERGLLCSGGRLSAHAENVIRPVVRRRSGPSGFLTVLAIVCATAAPTFAQSDLERPAYRGPSSAAEARFVARASADLHKRFGRAADAERAGYVRYTNVDETGAISYASRHWMSDPAHPSQLWYDAGGRLLGADWSRLNTPHRPNLWGIDPGRWIVFPDHIHYVVRRSGRIRYGLGSTVANFAAAGGDPHHPTAETLVRMGKARKASDVLTVFEFPRIWDLIVWVVPNPNGAFANVNPRVRRPPAIRAPSGDVH